MSYVILAYGRKRVTVDNIDSKDINELASHIFSIPQTDFYLVANGRKVTNNNVAERSIVYVFTRLAGGKGGFGSMLRAIGAQIEKTTNREACRDLSGRRLRDINEEKRLKSWIAAQAEREKEAEDRKQKKLERLCQQPKHEFKDEDYIKERSALPEKVEDAVAQGMKVATCSKTLKRSNDIKDKGKNKKPKLWVDADMDELSSSGEEDSGPDETSAPRVKTDSENSSEATESQVSKETTGDSQVSNADGGCSTTIEESQASKSEEK